ncbi:FAD-dependent oxidoreductase [Anaerobiospirillum succiniciproducens]|uniref:FAD-dependent oxidoreductase n=1 Tax=Anaerobiospirillum succiniciproducens TaxID=13335 RepID=UPI002357D7EC|nr:FAD-dependent oxidoreductase [Anaerobiospirillum succiniciproducens]MCI6864427.1 FAD-dependent oxidoreductase [Anaerobiospirillum succiniciproducens]
MKVVIIGGVAGGATAAARMRRNCEDTEIVLIERGDYISYANCGLPYYLGGVISDRDDLFVQTPASFGKRFNVDVRVQQEVTAIDKDAKSLTIRTRDGKEYTESYDKLLLSPGAAPVRPPLPGIDNEGIFTLRNVHDTDAIKSYMQTHDVQQAVIVGGGFIGLEMAENLVHSGVEVSVVEMANQVMGPIDYSMAAIVHQELVNNGVKLYLEQAVESFEKVDAGLQVNFKSGIKTQAQLVILSIGVRAETKLAVDAGIELGEMRGIKVDKYLKTSANDIYAVGDAIEYPHPITGKPWLNFLAGPANRQARIVADNIIFGDKVVYEGSIGTAVAKVFGLTVASTGLPSKRLDLMGIDHIGSYTHSAAHASYYPGGGMLDIKITFDKKTGQLYGAQVVGPEGVDKRIDEFAMVIKHKSTIYDLMELEHAYAPPFSSAKDPVAIAGYVASNLIEGRFEGIGWRELRDIDRDSIALIDVRTQEEHSVGHIPGDVNIPLDSLRDRLSEIPRDKKVVLYCGVGPRGYVASCILKGHGFNNVVNLCGGLRTYSIANAKVPMPSSSSSVTKASNCSSGCSTASAPVASGEVDLSNVEKVIDARGLQCPGPILKLKKGIEELQDGQVVQITAGEVSFTRDAESWCKSTGNTFIKAENKDGAWQVFIRKGGTTALAEAQGSMSACAATALAPKNDGKTFIMFSDDLDKALATFVLANGAAATGKKVTIFFTFWGLNAIKKIDKPAVEKDFFGKMFGMMLPSSTHGLKLSKMHMMGAGTKMMRYIMNKKGIESLESLRQQAIDNGVEFIACEMSMDVMGVKKEELLDNVTLGGVATYMERADHANVNLFI